VATFYYWAGIWKILESKNHQFSYLKKIESKSHGFSWKDWQTTNNNSSSDLTFWEKMRIVIMYQNIVFDILRTIMIDLNWCLDGGRSGFFLSEILLFLTWILGWQITKGFLIWKNIKICKYLIKNVSMLLPCKQRTFLFCLLVAMGKCLFI
jgi:hypothetical protein